jgi:hypothetical protein
MSELFNGTWKIDTANSRVWDDTTQSYAPDEVGDEIITLHVSGDIQDYEVLYGTDPTIRLGYTSRYDDPTWVPYLVRGFANVPEAELEQSIDAFRRRIKAEKGERYRRFEVGKAYGLIRTVFVDDRTHYRVSKSAEDASAQSVMLRRMAADCASYVSTVLDTNGIVYRVRTFVRA